MKLAVLTKLVLISGALVLPCVSVSAAWNGKNVAHLQSSNADADCFYFMLDGVAEADPVRPQTAWFAIPRSQFGAKDAYAMLLSAKLTGQVVNVSTNGTVSCGYATASAVWIP